MRARRNGCIVNVTSVAGKIACSPLAPYTASKFALEALSEVLAQEVKPFNIRVAIVEPGIVDTAWRGVSPMRRSTRVAPAREGALRRESVF
jgi:NAD(P)-dependent dehydrogenase (short-subunit alcohol dehydrogenase family)